MGMFKTGFSRTAKAKLLEICRKNINNAGLYEWDTKEGAGRGSDYYAGSAGSLARAVFEGYFGLSLGMNGLEIAPRLGEDWAKVHFYFPAADLYVAYDYQPDSGGQKIVFRYRSNFPSAGKVRLLLPWPLFGFENLESGRKKIRVLMDGQEIPVEWSSLNEDDSISFASDFRPHRVEVERRRGE